MKRIIFVLATTMITGCGIKPLVKIDTKNTFDAQHAKSLLAPGDNTIKGSALIRQNGGGVVTCAGGDVILQPETSYTAERINAIYGSNEHGYNPAFGGKRVEFNNTPKEYSELMRHTTCDAQGYFKFDNVAAGNFYLFTAITWQSGDYVTRGGVIMKKITVAGGETKEIVLTP